MEDKRTHRGIVDEAVLGSFPAVRGRSLMNHVSNSYGIEEALAIAALFWPELVEVDGCIFVSEFYNGGIEELKGRFGTNREIEMWVNSWSLESLVAETGPADRSADLIEEFAKAIRHFWQLRVDGLFPGRNVVVETGWGLMGEAGLSVTLYQGGCPSDEQGMPPGAQATGRDEEPPPVTGTRTFPL